MKKLTRQLPVIIVLTLVLMLVGAVAAAETLYVTDAKTGCQLGFAADRFVPVAASWTGPAVNGKAHGKGKFEFTLRTKDGKYTLKAGGEGDMVAGLLEGKGSLTLFYGKDNDAYEGDFKTGLFDGKGKINLASGDTYEGDWKAGVRDGKGIYRFKSGDVYDGEFKNGVREGQGTLKWANGASYVGGWKAGGFDGYGVLKDPSGKVLHDGQWKDGKSIPN